MDINLEEIEARVIREAKERFKAWESNRKKESESTNNKEVNNECPT